LSLIGPKLALCNDDESVFGLISKQVRFCQEWIVSNINVTKK
jgi:hypothetical protein